MLEKEMQQIEIFESKDSFSTGRFRITLRLNFSNVNISSYSNYACRQQHDGYTLFRISYFPIPKG
jgi:hypothetical protein